MKDLTLSFTIIIKGCMTKNMTPEQIAEQLNEHVQHEVKNLNIPAAMGELTCDNCGCHPNVIYITSKGRFCEKCKPAS